MDFSDFLSAGQKQDSVHDADSHFRSIASLVPDLLWSNDLQANVTWYNQNWYDYTGRSEEQSAGLGWVEAIHPEDRASSLARFRSAVQSGQPLLQEHRIRSASGQYRWFLVRAVPFRDKSGQIVQWFGSATDVHDERSAASALEESEARLRLALESASLGTWSYDKASRIATASERAREIFGASSAEGPLEYWFAYIHMDDRPHTESEFHGALEGAGPYDTEFRIVRQDGIHWVRARGQLFHSPRAGARVLATIEDVTKAKLAEQRLTRANEDLERFAWMASHDLQEPLRMVSIFAQMLGRQNLNDPARQYLDNVLSAAKRMQRLLADLLTLAHSGDESLSLVEAVDCEFAVADALDKLSDQVGLTKATITHDKLPTVTGNGELLTKVFQHLLANAIAFRKPNEALVIHVSALRDNETWVFSVADNGLGFESDQADYIFQAFTRLQPMPRSGSGLGLALCARIIERHGGRIWAESQPNKGSIFYFTLPLSPLKEALFSEEGRDPYDPMPTVKQHQRHPGQRGLNA